MNLKPRPDSIFATLTRKPWWISGLVAVGIAAFALLALPPVIAPAGVAAAVPFAIICGISAWKRRGMPSETAIENTAAALREMPWKTFSDVLAEGFTRDGSTVERINDPSADFLLTRSGRVAVVSARRWKAARLGVDSLKALVVLRQSLDAQESIFVTVGEISEGARAFASANDVRFLTANELARLLPSLRTNPAPSQ
jgi:hypothetical protein